MAMTHDEMIAVIQAHKEGKAIQCRPKKTIKWSETKNPSWDFQSYDYRVAPTPTWRPFTMEEYAKHFHRTIDRRDRDGTLKSGAWRPTAYDENNVSTGDLWITYHDLVHIGHCFIDTGERCGVLES